MTIILILSLILTLLPSCDSTIETRDIHVITVADDFYDKTSTEVDKNEQPNCLKRVINDQAALIDELKTLPGNVHIYAYTSQEGKRYYSKAPTFTPVDASGNKVERSSSAFNEFIYNDSSKESECWTMEDVLEKVRNLKTSTSPNDLIIFTYSGHGEKETGSLITNNKGSSNWDKTTTDEIIDAFSSIAGHKIFFLDSCYSGFFVPDGTLKSIYKLNSNGSVYMGNDSIKALDESSLDTTEEILPDFWVMSSAATGQTASDYLDRKDSIFQPRYGAFTYYLLKTLGYDMETNEAKAVNGSLTFYDIYKTIMEVFTSGSLNVQTPQSSLKRIDIRLR